MEMGYVPPPKGKGEGPSVTAAGYRVMPYREPSDAEVALNSGHPASLSNRLDQILNHGDALALTVADKATPPDASAGVTSVSAVLPVSSSAAETSALAPQPIIPTSVEASVHPSKVVDLDFDAEDVEDDRPLKRKPSGWWD